MSRKKEAATEYAYKVRISHFGQDPELVVVGVPIARWVNGGGVWLAERHSVFGCKVRLTAGEFEYSVAAAVSRALLEELARLEQNRRAADRCIQRVSALNELVGRLPKPELIEPGKEKKSCRSRS